MVDQVEKVARAIEAELIKEGLRLVKVVGAQPDARLVGHGAISLNAIAEAVLTAYNPNDSLREALEQARLVIIGIPISSMVRRFVGESQIKSYPRARALLEATIVEIDEALARTSPSGLRE